MLVRLVLNFIPNRNVKTYHTVSFIFLGVNISGEEYFFMDGYFKGGEYFPGVNIFQGSIFFRGEYFSGVNIFQG